MDVVNYFGPALVKIQVSQNVIDQLNAYSGQILQKENLPRSFDFKDKLASAVCREFSVKTGFLDDVEKFILNAGLEYYKKFSHASDPESARLVIKSMWIVSQREREWNYLHYHTGDISGVLYLKVPTAPATGLDPEDKRARLPGGITFADGPSSMFRRNLMNIQPAVGDLYLFPSSLIHTVYPFFGPEERRSFSFNLNVVL